MFCLLRLELELAIRAKGMLMAREAGFEVPIDDEIRASLAERAYLHQRDRADRPDGAAPAAGHERSRRVAPIPAAPCRQTRCPSNSDVQISKYARMCSAITMRCTSDVP